MQDLREVSLWGYYINFCIFVNECCFDIVLCNLHDFLYGLGPSYTETCGMKKVTTSTGLPPIFGVKLFQEYSNH